MDNESRFIPSHPAPEDGVQVGGHGGKDALIIEGEKCKKHGPPKETKFYELTQVEGPIKEYHDAHLIPHFYGIEKITNDEGETRDYIVMENLTHGFIHPVIVDFKMGTQTWDSDCSPKKLDQHKEIDAATTTASLGFRYGGELTYDAVKGCSTKYPKTYGLNATSETMINYMKEYLNNGSSKLRTDVIPYFIEQLKKQKEFADKKMIRFHASSLIHIYEGDISISNPQKPVIKLLDFAHYWFIDENDKEKFDAGFGFGVSITLPPRPADLATGVFALFLPLAETLWFFLTHLSGSGIRFGS